MSLSSYVAFATRVGASDVHLETGLPAAVRVGGRLVSCGEPLGSSRLEAIVDEIVGDDRDEFARQGSHDGSILVGGQRCRTNTFRTSRGHGVALRLLWPAPLGVESLNLHPALARLAQAPRGLVIVSGATSTGKSTTLAALVQEVNRARDAHVLTIESPIEYVYPPGRALIRQREVGRDTPSFEQALVDAMREDPDVVMVGEVRTPAAMRLVLDAAETGHLVLATMHSSTVSDALYRLVSAFPSEVRQGICAQLADVLVAALCQRLVLRPSLGVRVPELELLTATRPARSIVREGQFFKLPSVMQTGRRGGMWTLELYRAWLDARDDWSIPEGLVALGPEDVVEQWRRFVAGAHEAASGEVPAPPPAAPSAGDAAAGGDDVIVISPEDDSLSDILSELEDEAP